MTSWPETCNYCGAPIFRGRCPRCNYRKPVEGKVVLSGADITPGVSGPANNSLVINRGTVQNSSSSLSLTLPNVTVGTTGSMLACSIMFEISLASNVSVAWTGPLLTTIGAVDGTPNCQTVRLVKANAPAGTHDLVATFDGAVVAKAMTATEITGIKTAGFLDKSIDAVGLGTDADSGLEGITTQALDVLWATVFTEGPNADTPGTWTNSFIAAQRVGTTAAPPQCTVADAYRLVNVVGNYSAGKTGMTSRDWVAYIAALKTA